MLSKKMMIKRDRPLDGISTPLADNQIRQVNDEDYRFWMRNGPMKMMPPKKLNM